METVSVRTRWATEARRCGGYGLGLSHVPVPCCKKWVFSLLRKVDRQSVLRMSIGSELQTLGAATLNARA